MLTPYLRAGYPALYVVTQEPMRAEAAIAKEIADAGLGTTVAWDCVRGIRAAGNGKIVDPVLDPVDVCKWLDETQDTILLVHNLHLFTEGIPDLIQALQNGVETWKSKGSALVAVCPTVKLPLEWQKLFHVIDFPLPDLAMLTTIQTELAKTVELEANPASITMAKGLTEFEAETAFSYSLAITGKFDPRVVVEAKSQMIRKNGQMEFTEPVPIEEVGGLGNFKDWFQKRMTAFQPGSTLPKVRALLFTGIPGTGKSQMSKALASYMNWPLIRLDIASLQDSLVGKSEQNMRAALQTIDAFGEAIIWVDEIEKALGKSDVVKSGGGGVMDGILGLLLTWMQETKTPCILAATANRAYTLPAELIRRFNCTFFVDTPTLPERREIIAIMNKRFSAELPVELAERLEGYTGDEIRKIAENSRFDGLDRAFEMVTPIAKTSKEDIETLRQWSQGRTVTANTTPDMGAPKETRKLKLI